MKRFQGGKRMGEKEDIIIFACAKCGGGYACECAWAGMRIRTYACTSMKDIRKRWRVQVLWRA